MYIYSFSSPVFALANPGKMGKEFPVANNLSALSQKPSSSLLTGSDRHLKSRWNKTGFFARTAVFAASWLVFAVYVAGCGSENSPLPPVPSTACGTATAWIRVEPGQFRGLCGCQEGDAITPTFTCTVNQGTQVHLQFGGSPMSHQLIFQEGQPFVASPIYNPKAPKPITDWGFTLNTAGTFTFSDAFQPHLTGVLKVL